MQTWDKSTRLVKYWLSSVSEDWQQLGCVRQCQAKAHKKCAGMVGARFAGLFHYNVLLYSKGSPIWPEGKV